MIDYMIHAPDRATFIAVMAALAHPADGRPLATLDDATGRLIAHRDVRIDEIGPISKGHWDGEDWIVDETVGGWHVNLRAIGRLAEALGDHDGIYAYLGAMAEMTPQDGVPYGMQGASGIRIINPTSISTPVRTWA